MLINAMLIKKHVMLADTIFALISGLELHS